MKTYPVTLLSDNTGIAPTLFDGLISCWGLDEASGTTAYDSTGYSNGTIQNGTTVNQAGKVGTSYLFDGDNDTVTTNIDTLPDSFSIAFWVNHDMSSTVGYDQIIAKGDFTGTHTFGKNELTYQQYGTAMTCYCYMRNTVAGYVIAYDSTALTAGTWYHKCLTFDGTYLRLYHNAVLQGTSGAWTGTRIHDTSYDLKMGHADHINVTWYKGNLDQVALWSRAIGTDELDLIYNAGSGLAYTSW